MGINGASYNFLFTWWRFSGTECEKAESILPKVTVDFGDSPLPPEWKKRITSMLNSMPYVFALNDLDYGHTDQVKHRIKLSNEILPNSGLKPSFRSKNAVSLPVAEPRLEKDEERPVSITLVDKGNLPDVETSNPAETDRHVLELPVESSLSDLLEIQV